MTEAETKSEAGTAATPISAAAARRSRLYRKRKKEGARCVRIELIEPVLQDLEAGGFLPHGKRDDLSIETAFYALLIAANRAGVTARDT